MLISRRLTLRLALAFATLFALPPLSAWGAAPAKPPVTRTDNVREMLHGVEIVDPYRWLEDKDAPETRAWIASQNEYTESLLGTRPEAASIRARLTELLKVDQVTVPYERAGRYFYTNRRHDQDLAVIVMRQGAEGKEQVLVDPHPLSPDHTVSVNILDVSEDGTLLAYGTRKGGEDEVAVTILDVTTLKELPDRLPRARYFGISIKPDRSGIFYTRFNSEGSRIFHHRMGADPATDELLFGQGYGPEKIVASDLSEDGRQLLIAVYYGSATDRSEVYLKDVATGGPVVPIVNDIEAYFAPATAGGRIYMQTNWKASNWRILEVDPAHPSRDRWKEIVPETDAVIDDFAAAGGKIVVNALKNVVSSVRVYGADGKLERTLDFPTLGTVSQVRGRWAGDEVFFSFSSFLVPNSIQRYAASKGERKDWWKPDVPVKAEGAEVKQVWFKSKDGTKIPMFLVHRKGLKLDGKNPTYLTGYGGFTVSETPAYKPLAALWVERGGVYALPNLRGGGEFGETWHRAGMLDRKQNVFDDFLAAADWLKANRYTSTEKLAIAGGSNGGLLVGAALTQKPDQFGAVICSVPLLDMLRYHQFLVARFWVPEYGSSENPDQFKVLHAYSPYHHVTKGVKYPAVLFVTGDSDTRVDPLHARKMTALMQASTGSDRPVLLHYDTKLGHSGGKPVSKQIDDLTVDLTFLYWQLGVGKAAEAALTGSH